MLPLIIKNIGVFAFNIIKRKKLKKGKYQVVIKSKLSKGNVEIGLEKLKGKTDK